MTTPRLRSKKRTVFAMFSNLNLQIPPSSSFFSVITLILIIYVNIALLLPRKMRGPEFEPVQALQLCHCSNAFIESRLTAPCFPCLGVHQKPSKKTPQRFGTRHEAKSLAIRSPTSSDGNESVTAMSCLVGGSGAASHACVPFSGGKGAFSTGFCAGTTVAVPFATSTSRSQVASD